MELLWNHLSNVSVHLPYALVAKQSAFTARINERHYKRLRKRWVDKHLQTSAEARYIHTMATMPVGRTDTLFFPKKHPNSQGHQGPVAVIIDGESASASVSFAGAFQDQRGPLLGEACMGPSNGTMGNPYVRRLPHSGIFVSLSTAMYLAKPAENWAAGTPFNPTSWCLICGAINRTAKAVDQWIQTLTPLP